MASRSPLQTSDLIKHYKIKEAQLEEECSDQHLATLAQSKWFFWRHWVKQLGLSDQRTKDIDGMSLDETGKAQKALNVWQDTKFLATYGDLVETFLGGGNAKLAGEVCELLKGTGNTKECEKCTPLQTSFLEDLKKELEVFKTLGPAADSFVEVAVDKYVHKFIQAGSTDSVDHLHEHLQQLHETEKLISDPDLLDKAKTVSCKASSLRVSSAVLNIGRSSPATLCKETLATPFLIRLFYDASICNRAVNKCTVDNFQEFIKAQNFHSLREVSLSHSSHERYLIAMGSDSTCYIAFRSEPGVTGWTRKYKSLSEGVVSQTEKFPIHFILELLNKGRVVLTGFSFGGLLACSVATQIWLSRYLSSFHLQENLMCITFAQPHIPVPQLAAAVREYPEIVTTIHAIYNKEDPVPQLMKFLDLPVSFIIQRKRRKRPPPFEDAMTLRLADEIGNFINQAMLSDQPRPAEPSYELRTVLKVFPDEKSPQQPVMTYHLLTSEQLEEVSPKEVFDQTSLNRAGRGFNFVKHRMEAYVDTCQQHLMEADVKESSLQRSLPPVSSLSPALTKIELHNHGTEFVLTVEGSNLSFCNELCICGEKFRISHHISGKSIEVNFKVASHALRSLKNGQKVEVGVQTLFTSCVVKNVPFFTKAFVMSIRQQQLAKLTPSQVIELSYLSALLEQQPFEHSKLLSDKVAAIREFLEKIVQIIPIESIGYAVIHGNSYVAMRCNEAIEASSLTLSSVLMSDALKSTRHRISLNLPYGVSHVPTSVICGLNLNSLYPIASSVQGLKSPIDTLQHGRNRLSSQSTVDCSSFPNVLDMVIGSSKSERRRATSLPAHLLTRISSGSLPAPQQNLSTRTSTSSLNNSLMLQAVNEIRHEDLAVCISLITGFINQQEIDIPLLKTGRVYISGEQFALSIWALSSLGVDDVHRILDEHYNKEMTVRVENYNRGSQFVYPEALAEREYAGKLHFMVQAMQRTVSCNSHNISYSLERQLVLLCQERNITDSIPLDELIGHWDKIFEKDILSLVAKSHRPLVARWLYWSLMVHNLREELAKSTVVGVVGLVNSGKSGLARSLFGVQISSGTTEEKRTTLPFIYNLDEKVKGLDVVDFPGVDDKDESISELADLILTLAQIIVFVVDYRRIHTVSAKKWLERLQVEKVPFLVCLTFADKLYAEYMAEYGQHPYKGFMSNELEVQLSKIREKLELPGNQQIMFCSFKQDIDSVLNCEEGRQTLRDVGIKTPLEVGDWLVEALQESFGQDEIAKQLHTLLHAHQHLVPLRRTEQDFREQHPIRPSLITDGRTLPWKYDMVSPPATTPTWEYDMHSPPATTPSWECDMVSPPATTPTWEYDMISLPSTTPTRPGLPQIMPPTSRDRTKNYPTPGTSRPQPEDPHKEISPRRPHLSTHRPYGAPLTTSCQEITHTEAFVSLVTNDSYALGAVTLGRSLRNTRTSRRLVLLITSDVSHNMRGHLSRLWDELVLVEVLDSGDSEHLALLTRPELGNTFSKIHVWRLTQYTKCVFLDADTMVLQNVDELFDREEISAASDIGWPDCFNSGVFVFEPFLQTFKNLLDLANQKGSFDGGDQGLLNSYWSDWATKHIKYHLPFIYNVSPNITYGYAPAFHRFGHSIKIIHFIGPNKPWQHRYLPEVDAADILFPGTYASEHALQYFVKRWWQLYTEAEPSVEDGYTDFNTCDSYDNIQAHIDKIMNED